MASPITKLWYITLKPTKNPTDPEFTQVWTDVFAWAKSSGSSTMYVTSSRPSICPVQPTRRSYPSHDRNYLDHSQIRQYSRSLEKKTNTDQGPHRQLWQNISLPTSLVLVNGWPSAAARDAAMHSPEEVNLAEKLTPYIDSRGYKQLEIDISTVPLTAPILSVETFSVAAADSALFERKALQAQTHVDANTQALAAVGSWDVYAEQLKKAVQAKTDDVVGEDAATQGIPPQRSWVSITGWADEETHVESAREMTKEMSKESGVGEEAREKVEGTQNVFETVHLKKIMG